MLGSGDGGHIVKLRGLPFSTTVDDVINFLSNVSIVNGKDGIHMKDIRPGRPSGECYVEVETQQDVEEALKKDKENMGKRYIEVFSIDRQDMEWALNAMRQNSNGYGGASNVSDDMGVVRLRGLPFGCSKEEIVQFFGGLRVAPDGVHILSDTMGRASGEAFVHFVDKETAQQALQKDREKIGHRYIEVFNSSPEEVRYYQSRMEGGGGGNRGSGMGGMNNTMGRGYGRPVPYDRNDRFGGNRFNSRGGGTGGRGGYNSGGWNSGSRGGSNNRSSRGGGSAHCVHMRGLPFKATPQDVVYFFKPLRPVNVEILFENNGRPSGEADVEFECHDDAVRAMGRDHNNMNHRYIELFLNSTPGRGGYSSRNFQDLY